MADPHLFRPPVAYIITTSHENQSAPPALNAMAAPFAPRSEPQFAPHLAPQSHPEPASHTELYAKPTSEPPARAEQDLPLHRGFEVFTLSQDSQTELSSNGATSIPAASAPDPSLEPSPDFRAHSKQESAPNHDCGISELPAPITIVAPAEVASATHSAPYSESRLSYSESQSAPTSEPRTSRSESQSEHQSREFNPTAESFTFELEPQTAPPASEEQYSPPPRRQRKHSATEAAHCNTASTRTASGSDLRFRPRAVAEPARYDAFPAAARRREITKAANRFAGNGRNIFVHHVEPVLQQRRCTLLATRRRARLFSRTAAQLWPTLSPEQSFFWKQKAVELRLALKQNTLSAELCLLDAGHRDEWRHYRLYAEMAVATYLEQDLPQEFAESAQQEPAMSAVHGGNTEATILVAPTHKHLGHEVGAGRHTSNAPRVDDLEFELGTKAAHLKSRTFIEQDRLRKAVAHLSDTLLATSSKKAAFPISAPITFAHTDTTTDTLLDVLPERFDVEPRMMYDIFAHVGFEQIRSMEGWKQVSKLRQLADRFDPTGKTLFYYYAYPRVWKQLRPPDVDETVATVVHDAWRAMSMQMKVKWEMFSRRIKRLLGDGTINGLDMLQLDSMNPEVLEIHALCAESVGEGQARSPEASDGIEDGWG